jgi:hypothetical protein
MEFSIATIAVSAAERQSAGWRGRMILAVAVIPAIYGMMKGFPSSTPVTG